MLLERYELLARTTVPEAQRESVTELLSVAEAFINHDCNNQFLAPDGSGGVTVVLPLDVEPGVVLLIKAFQSDPSLASKSLAGMSKSFVQNGAFMAARAFWQSYKKARFF